MNSNLYSKAFDLKPSQLFGGNSTYKDSSSETADVEGCTDVAYVTKDDNGIQISKCTEYDCDY